MCLIEDAATVFRPFNSIRSTISRTVITYNWKFGSYGYRLRVNSQNQMVFALMQMVNIIIADTNNNRVQVFDRMGRFKLHLVEDTSSG
uniref:Brain tumor protein n=1 Tax=Triatoma infestans TaxID=30076 RepID=A0A161MK37_TRIIF